MQTKKQSLIESATNTAVGFVISLCATFVVMPLFGFNSSFGKNLGITLVYTAISIVRGYVVRRWFNKKVKVNKLPDFKYKPPVPCFYCNDLVSSVDFSSVDDMECESHFNMQMECITNKRSEEIIELDEYEETAQTCLVLLINATGAEFEDEDLAVGIIKETLMKFKKE